MTPPPRRPGPTRGKPVPSGQASRRRDHRETTSDSRGEKPSKQARYSREDSGKPARHTSDKTPKQGGYSREDSGKPSRYSRGEDSPKQGYRPREDSGKPGRYTSDKTPKQGGYSRGDSAKPGRYSRGEDSPKQGYRPREDSGKPGRYTSDKTPKQGGYSRGDSAKPGRYSRGEDSPKQGYRPREDSGKPGRYTSDKTPKQGGYSRGDSAKPLRYFRGDGAAKPGLPPSDKTQKQDTNPKRRGKYSAPLVVEESHIESESVEIIEAAPARFHPEAHRQRYDKPKLAPQVTTLWDYPSQHYGDEQQGSSSYVGATPSYVIWNVVSRFTESSALVVDPFCGSGTSIDVCRDLGRDCRGFDVAPTRADIENADARSLPLKDKSVDLVFMDPPYGDNVDYSDDSRCIGKLKADGRWQRAMRLVLQESARVLKDDAVLAVYVCDIFQKDRGFFALGFDIFAFAKENFIPLDIVSVVRHNRTLQMGNYRKAADEGNYLLRGFNYLMLFRKRSKKLESTQIEEAGS